MRLRPRVILTSVLLGLGLGLTAFAQAPDQFGVSYGSYTGLTSTDIRVTIGRIVQIALGLLGIVAVLLVLYAGFTWMTAGGDEEKVATAKKTLSAAVIGLVIISTAFAIASFVIGRLSDATGLGQGTEQTGGGPGGGGGFGGGAGTGFRPVGIQPTGALGKFDVQPNLTFSSAPTGDAANIKANVLLEKIVLGVRTAVDYDPTVERNSIRLVPKTACPDPNAAKKCLEPDTDYVLTIRAGLKNASGNSNVNCGFGASCGGLFTTGGAVGTAPPGISITNPTDGQSVPAGSFVQVQSRVTDEYGIGGIDYLADGAFFSSDGAPLPVAPKNWTSQVSWDTAAVAAGTTVPLTAEATNIDGDKGASSAIRVVVRAPHCFNGSKDADETGPDCGGKDCGACAGSSCTTGANCASGECVQGQCVDTPKIVDVQARNGKPGNLITLTGERFGNLSGKVVFLGGADAGDDVEAVLGACEGAWSNNRIVVEVPATAADGPIKVVTGAAKEDATNDAYGPIITDFDVNDIARPGICAVTPAAAKPSDVISLTGSGFGTAQDASKITFTKAGADCVAVSPTTAYDAGAVDGWTDVSARPKIPSVAADPEGTRYLVTVTAFGQISNPACVLALAPDAGTTPRIEFLSPIKGAVGSYLTVSGENFGVSGKVKFTRSGQTAYGDVSFPAQCSGGTWKRDNVIVKVPAQFTVPKDLALLLGDYSVSVERSDAAESNIKTFTVSNDPIGPAICRLDPESGPAGTPVSIYGEHFGDLGSDSLSSLLIARPDAVTFHEAKGVTGLGRWDKNSITTSVPAGAKTGPVFVRTFFGSTANVSNPSNFRVEDCRKVPEGTPACETGRSCCPDGSCRPDGSCAATASSGAFAWQFSTGPIPVYPVVIENATCQLQAPVRTPSPNPYRGATEVCLDMDKVTAQFSLPMDRSSLNAGTVKFEACGNGDRATTTCVAGPAGAITVANGGSGQDNVLEVEMAGLQPDTWYRLTLKGSGSGAVIRSAAEDGRPSQIFDGDADGQAGGDYVTTFRTGKDTCTIAAVDVQPGSGLIESATAKLEYQANPISARCIILACPAGGADWESSNTAKATIVPQGPDACAADASPVAETAPGPDIDVTGTVAGKSDAGTLKIDYTNPTVQSYGPADCTEACINTVPFARFNTAMAPSGPGAVTSAARIVECLDESCRSFRPGDIAARADLDATGELLTVAPSATLKPDAFHRVIIDGRAESTSQAALTSLNYADGGSSPNAFSWVFRTRPGNDPCGPQAVAIEPSETVLHYIGEIAPVTAVPKTQPDSCSAEGQILTMPSYSWDWSKDQDPATYEAFSLAPYDPFTPGAAPASLDTTAVLAAGCTSRCLMAGSSPSGTPACGNGTAEKGEDAGCDPAGAAKCDNRCLLTGNLTVGKTAGLCGNGVVEKEQGEACDEGDANGAADSGCTKSCLKTGALGKGLSECGNRTIGPGEACDDGNTASGDGCSSSCLNEGSARGLAVCGNGLREIGEACDYRTGADGKATSLLLASGEVPLSGAFSKNPNDPSFVCSNRCLLTGNPKVCSSGADCCGNGAIDPAAGESCDAGAMNGDPRSGCSDRCLKTGSHAAFRGYCGDGRATVVAQDGVVDNGGGEEVECESGGGDGRVDATQYVTALNRCEPFEGPDACEASAVAALQGLSVTPGRGNVTVSCSCAADNDCAPFGAGLACGAGACCFKRPDPPAIEPVGADVCRNALVAVTFGEVMDEASFKDNLAVFEQKGGCTLPVAFAYADGGSRWYSRAWSAVVQLIKSAAGADAKAATDCAAVAGKWAVSTVSQDPEPSKSVATFTPAAPFGATATYVVAVKPGVKNRNGVGRTERATGTFTTGRDICALKAVEVAPPTGLIQSSSQVLSLSARTLALRENGELEAIAPLPGTYAWSLAWNVDKQDLLQLGTISGDGKAFTAGAPASGSLTAAVKAPAGKNGDAQVVATAVITEDVLFTPPTKDQAVVGRSAVKIFVCENPWPARDSVTGAWAPYVDSATHFSFFYCRDKGRAQDTSDDLPALSAAPTQGQSPVSGDLLRFCRTWTETGAPSQPRSCSTDAQCGGRAGDCLPKDLLFRFADPKLRDAVGMRAYENADRVSPKEWYDAKGFKGAVQPSAQDGYSGIRDERTVYVSAPDKYGDPELRSYVYVFGTNEGATPETDAIFGQLLQNLQFNTNLVPDASRVINICKLKSDPSGAPAKLAAEAAGKIHACSSDLDCHKAFGDEATAGLYCDSDKDKLRRDMLRWEGLFRMTDGLEALKDATGFYPALDAGSYLRGVSVSTWPSWRQQLGPAGAVVDPLNAFNRCDSFGSECSVTQLPCVTDDQCAKDTPGDVCRPKFEAATCFSSREARFMCPAYSHVYRYQAIGGIDYRLHASFEYAVGVIPWAGGCADTTSEFVCIGRKGCLWDAAASACKSRIVTDSPACSGVPIGKQVCRSSGAACTADKDCASGPNAAADVCVRVVEAPGTLFLGGSGAASCGNGLVESGETCEIGQTVDQSCANGAMKQRCAADCKSWVTVQACPGAAACGNGAVELGESCDEGARNGEYGRCRGGYKGCARYCVRATARTAFLDASDITGTCTTNAGCGAGFVCTDRKNFCGDGVRNGSESCDDGLDNGKYGKCAWDCGGPGPRCGDSVTNGSEQCDGTSTASPGICVSAGGNAPPTANFTAGAEPCRANTDCPTGKFCQVCPVTTDAQKLPQSRVQACATVGTLAQCELLPWSACRPSGSCGNGVKEGAEQCDEGTANSVTGRCLPTCQLNVCNDGNVLKGVEQCDDGASNGTKCSPQYGLTCNYCKNDCTIETISGQFCGNSSPTYTKLDTPAESCDPGRVVKWCSKTYLTLDATTRQLKGEAFGANATTPSGPKACGTNSDCSPGVCKNYFDPATMTLGARDANCPKQNNPLSRCVPDDFNACSKRGNIAGCCDDQSPGCKCPPGYTYQKETMKCEFKQPTTKPEGASCRNANDCDPNTQYCDGGEGECIAYNSQCTPDRYSNPLSSPPRVGDCAGCSNQCGVIQVRSPYSCGDGTVSPEFGEQCEEVGDPGATGPNGTRSYYKCDRDCSYDIASGYCGNGQIDFNDARGENEKCDGAAYEDNKNTCELQGWGRTGEIDCIKGCVVYGAGCSDGPLNPGEVRVRLVWDDPIRDLDFHVWMPAGYSGSRHIFYDAKGSFTGAPYVRLSADDIRDEKGDNSRLDTYAEPYQLEIITVRWNDKGRYWSDANGTDAYKFYVDPYGGANFGSNAKVILCTYDPTKDKRQDCSRQWNAPTNSTAYWHVFDLYGEYEDAPKIRVVNKAVSGEPR